MASKPAPSSTTVELTAPIATGSARADRRAVAKAARLRRRFERAEIRRFTRRSRSRRLAVLVGAGSVVALVLLVTALVFSPLMAVTTVQVVGASRVDPAAVQQALSSEIGQPLTLVDGAAVAEDLAGFPLIRSYSVAASPPNTLVITIVEREPVGVVQTPAGFTLVDAAGVTIETGPAAQPGFPLVTTPTGTASGDAFAAAARVILALPDSLDGQVSAVSATTPDDVTLALAGGASVLWGSDDDSAKKAVVLAELMAATDPASVTRYDVSSPSSAVVVP